MDDPALDERAHRRALGALGRINGLSRTAAQFARRIQVWGRDSGMLRVLDVACGGGDVALALQERAVEMGLRLKIDGCDRSLTAVEFARLRARRSGVGFFVRDVVRDGLPEGYDVVVSSLFLHHLGCGEAERLLREMAAATTAGLIVSDLDRRRYGLWLAAVVPRLLSRSKVVHVDALRSVRASFTMNEVGTLAVRAGLAGFRLTRSWPARWTLTWSKNTCP
jgi:SAM-dependent methyltransferase